MPARGRARAVSPARCSGRATTSSPAARCARSSSAAGPTTSGPATARSGPCSTASSAASRSSASRTGSTRRSRRCRAVSAGGSRWRARCSTAPTSCCSTSPRTTSTSTESTGSRATSRQGADRSSSSRTTAGSSTPCAPRHGRSPTRRCTSTRAATPPMSSRARSATGRGARPAAREARRRQLVRKELPWLRRGPPARTSKPKFRIEAASALIAGEPEPRDRVELLRFATARLGGKVIDAVGISVAFGDRIVLRDATWRLGPGERLAVVGANGSGKTTLVDVLAGERAPDAGTVERGATVRLAHLRQDAVEVPGHLRVLEALTEIRGRIALGDGSELTAGQLAERFGFHGDRGLTLVRDLSGGERRRLHLMRLLMGEPNVLLLDEPTNDLDIDTLTALEDLLDGWPGTLVVISHDRWFVERVCDDVYALDGAGAI